MQKFNDVKTPFSFEMRCCLEKGEDIAREP